VIFAWRASSRLGRQATLRPLGDCSSAAERRDAPLQWRALTSFGLLLFAVNCAPDSSRRIETAYATPVYVEAGFYAGLTWAAADHARETVQQALESHRSADTLEWSLGGSMGSVTPLRTYKVKSGAFCRNYRETLDNADRDRRRTACRTQDGRWLPLKRDA